MFQHLLSFSTCPWGRWAGWLSVCGSQIRCWVSTLLNRDTTIAQSRWLRGWNTESAHRVIRSLTDYVPWGNMPSAQSANSTEGVESARLQSKFTTNDRKSQGVFDLSLYFVAPVVPISATLPIVKHQWSFSHINRTEKKSYPAAGDFLWRKMKNTKKEDHDLRWTLDIYVVIECHNRNQIATLAKRIMDYRTGPESSPSS